MEHMYKSDKLDIFCKLLTGIYCFLKYKNVGFGSIAKICDDICEATQLDDCLDLYH